METPISALLERKGASVHSVPANVSVTSAVAEMNRHRVGSVVILDGEQLVGIFTERDVLQRVVGAGLDPTRTPVTAVMTSKLITIVPDTTVQEAMTIFTEKRCRHLPVLVAGRLAGLISIGDVSRWTVDLHRTESEHLKNYIAGGFPQ